MGKKNNDHRYHLFTVFHMDYTGKDIFSIHNSSDCVNDLVFDLAKSIKHSGDVISYKLYDSETRQFMDLENLIDKFYYGTRETHFGKEEEK